MRKEIASTQDKLEVVVYKKDKSFFLTIRNMVNALLGRKVSYR